jgi:hypothetical protein
MKHFFVKTIQTMTLQKMTFSQEKYKHVFIKEIGLGLEGLG